MESSIRRDESWRELAEAMRAQLSKIYAFTSATAELFEQMSWTDSPKQHCELNRIAYLLDHLATLVFDSMTESEHRLRAVTKRGR
jgi:hypothetical protein